MALQTPEVQLDLVKTYFGIRKISLRNDSSGRPRIMLNDEFSFQVGFLDQVSETPTPKPYICLTLRVQAMLVLTVAIGKRPAILSADKDGFEPLEILQRCWKNPDRNYKMQKSFTTRALHTVRRRP